MQVVRPIDGEDALRRDVSALWGHTCHAEPLPDTIAAPCAVAYQLGGATQTRVSFEHDFAVDVYADTVADAIAEANAVAAIVCALPEHGTAAVWHDAAITTLTYDNPDPRHPQLARATFAARLHARGEVAEI